MPQRPRAPKTQQASGTIATYRRFGSLLELEFGCGDCPICCGYPGLELLVIIDPCVELGLADFLRTGSF
ncbi:MAG: hypothetical protein M3N32_05605 [Actinomycetota bacterium]|nr:hypothetical protein [Actinomycetota bacterium]